MEFIINDPQVICHVTPLWLQTVLGKSTISLDIHCTEHFTNMKITVSKIYCVQMKIHTKTKDYTPDKILGSTGCPTRYRTRHIFNNSNTNKDIATKQTHTTDTFLFISHTTNVLLFKFRCNIFIGFRIIKEMPGSVASETPCIRQFDCLDSSRV